MYILIKPSYFTYRSFKSKIQNVEFQFGKSQLFTGCPADAEQAAMLGRAEDTLTRIHSLWQDHSAKRSTWNHQC